MRIDVWIDPLCPFCHLGRRQLDLALQEFEHADEVHVFWHSFQLDPDAPAEIEGSNVDRLGEKYGVSREQMEIVQEQLADEAAQIGLDYRWEQAVAGNSYDAHRLIHAAYQQGVEQEVTDRLMRAWFSEGRSLGDRATLQELATQAGLDGDVVTGVLDSDSFGAEVRADRELAGRLGITSVPFFVLDQKFGVPGAQPPDTMLRAIRHAWEDQGNPGAGGGCGAGGCGCGAGAQDGPAPEPAPAASGCGSGACGCR